MIFDKEQLQLKQVINASGKMTILGVSKVSDQVLEAQKYGAQHFFEMEQLMRESGKYLAGLIKTEDAQIVSSASAGIVQSIAAVIGQGSLYHLYHPYTDERVKREIILPKGHNVDYGTSVELMVQQGGGKMVEAGYANMCSKEHILQMINERTAAILYIKSHHTVQKSILTIKEAAEIAETYQLPLIVDAAAEDDLYKYTGEGADLVIYSGAKAFEGPSSGIVIGKKPFVEWVRLQTKGLGRSMKIGKENVLGLTKAIEKFITDGSESGELLIKRLTPFVEEINQLPNLAAEIVQDGAGRDIYRAKVMVVSGDKTARDLVEEMKQGAPAIYTREYQVNNNIIEFDVRAVNEKELDFIASQLKKSIRE